MRWARVPGLALLVLCGVLTRPGAAAPGGPGSVDDPDATDPTRRVDPRGWGPLSVTRRSPAGWLYAFPYETVRTRPLWGPWRGALSLEWGGVFKTGNDHETRYERYADRSDGVLLNSAWLALDHAERPLYLRARALAVGREDQAYALEGGAAGRWRVRGDFSRIRRHYAKDARSLLDNVGAQRQRLRGGLVAGGNSQAAIDAAIADLRRQTFSTKRDRSGIRVDVTPTPLLRLFSSYRFEDRDGARPFGGALGFPRIGPIGQWIESAEPVDAYTHRFDTGVEWGGERTQANLRYGLSLFRNRSDTLRFENPFDLGDPDIREGRFALYPSNRAHQIEGDFAWSLPGRVRVGASAAWSRHRQNGTLLTPTINSGTVGAGAGTLDLDLWNQRDALARDDADARIDHAIAHVYALWSPDPRLRLRASARLEDHDDDTRYTAFNPLVDRVGYVSEDGALEATTPLRRVFQPGQAVSDDWRYRSIPTSYRRYHWDLEADYRLYGKTRLRATVARRSVERDHRARRRTRERTIQVALTSRDLRGLTLRLGYDGASRSGSPYDLDRLQRYFVSALPGYVAPLPGGVTPPYGLAQQRQSDLANRTAHHGRLHTLWLLRDDMDLALAVDLRRQNYRAAYGLRHRDSDAANLQWHWRPRPALEAHLVYGFERRTTEMRLVNDSFALSSDPNAGGPWFPLDNAWTQRSRARVHYVGSTLRWIPHTRLQVSVDYTLQQSVESLRYDFASAGALPSGVTPGEAGDNLPDLRYRDHLLVTELRVDLLEEASLRIFHRYQRSFVRDFAQRGLAPNYADRGVVLAHVDGHYRAHFFGFMAQLRF